MKVLVVCSGNICRSPMVAFYLRHRLAQEGLAHVVVDSAGTLGIEGAPAAREAVVAMGELGINLREHRSRGLRPADLKTSDVVLVMDRGHLETLAARFPEGRGERHLLRAFERSAAPDADAPDLDDPIGSGVRVFREQRERIVACVDHLVSHLRATEAAGG